MRSSQMITRLFLAGAVLVTAASSDLTAQATRPTRPSIATRPARPATARAQNGAGIQQRGQKGRLQKQRIQKQRQHRRKMMQRRIANATPEQQAYMKSMIAQRQTIRQQVAAGTLDRQGAQAQMQAWRKSNARPARPARPAHPTTQP